MPYSAQISRKNPTLFVFLIDQSGSMDAEDSQGKKLSEHVSETLNRLIAGLLLRCTKNEDVRDYFHLAVIGYSGSGVQHLIKPEGNNRTSVKISEIPKKLIRTEEKKRKVPDGAGGLVEIKFNYFVWIEPMANGGTPMVGAFAKAKEIIAEFIQEYPNSYPPIILNLTDGEPSDWSGNGPIPEALDLMKSKTTDGDVLVLNCHMSVNEGYIHKFPDSPDKLDPKAKDLFYSSSILPEVFLSAARERDYKVSPNSRGYMYNADITNIIQFLEIGTRVDQLAITGPER